jgi:GNAT superfamily N-acetyltransferase
MDGRTANGGKRWVTVSGRPSESIRVRELAPEDGRFLQQLLNRLPDAEAGFGHFTPSDALGIFVALSKDRAAADRFLFGVWDGAGLVGAGALLKRYPAEDAWTVGLFVLDTPYRGRGLGRALLEWVESAAWDAEAAEIRCPVGTGNAAGGAFLETLGYEQSPREPNGERALGPGERIVYRKPRP